MEQNKKNYSKSEQNKRKISFFSAVLLVIGSSAGAGIFIKNREILGNVNMSIILTLVAWLISVVAVICMAISLAEIGSADTKSNLGILSWVKNFCHHFVYKTVKYFMSFVYLPVCFFVMPYYAVLQFQIAFGWQTNWWVISLIVLGLFLFFLTGTAYSAKLGNIQNKIISSFKFIPFIFAIVAGIVVACLGYSSVGDTIHFLPTSQSGGTRILFQKQLPILGVVSSIPAIIFSFDGFYVATGVQSEMQEPKKTPLVLVCGLLFSSTVYVLITIALLVGSSDGRIINLGWFRDHQKWIIRIMQILIAGGILGAVNGFSMYISRYYDNLIKLHELPFSKQLEHLSKENKPIAGLIYGLSLIFIFFVIFTIIGVFAYFDVTGYSKIPITNFANQTFIGFEKGHFGNLNNLYSFCDLIANWTAIFIFMCVVFSIIGAIINRKTNKVKVEKIKAFLPCAWIASILISLAVCFIIVQTFANIVIVNSWKSQINNSYSREQWIFDMIGAITTMFVLLIYLIFPIILATIETKCKKKIDVPVQEQKQEKDQ